MSRRAEPNSALADKIIAAFDSMSVDPERVASFVSLAGPAIKLKLYRFVMQLLYIWSQEFDNGELGPDDNSMRIQINAKRLIEYANKNTTVV